MRTKRIWTATAALLACCALSDGQVAAQTADVFFQATDDAAPEPLAAEKKQALQDPFFRLVLAPRPDAIKLSDIEALIQPDPAERRISVVDEEIKDPTQPQSRRGVLDFTGMNGAFKLDNNVMVSVFFGSNEVPEISRLEAWGWDEPNGVFNFYVLDRGTPDCPQRKTNPNCTDPPPLSWKLRATSEKADRLSVAERQGTCLRCHTMGAPNMKELEFPWNNWNSFISIATYLTRDQGAPAERWPVAADARFAHLNGAENLELAIKAAIGNFNAHKLKRFVTSGTGGALAVKDAAIMLRPLFATTEVNLRSATQQSGLHPLPQVNQTGPAEPVSIPPTFFLDSTTLTKLGIEQASFADIPTIQPAEYKDLVTGAGLQILSSRPGVGMRPGDTNFAWFTPEPGFAQISWIGLLIDQQVVSPAFAAAVLGVDVEAPLFSEARAGLLQFVPDTYTATPGEPHPDALTRAVIARLTAANPPAGSPAADFLAILTTPSPVDTVRARVAAYHDRVVKQLDPGNPTTRQAELQRLFGLLNARRQAFLNHELFGNLAEFPALLPQPQR